MADRAEAAARWDAVYAQGEILVAAGCREVTGDARIAARRSTPLFCAWPEVAVLPHPFGRAVPARAGW